MKTYTPVPDGFVEKYVKGRRVFAAKSTKILLEHDSLVAHLLAERGEKKCTKPDQLACVRPHLGHRFMYKLDLCNAYDAVPAFGLLIVLNLDDEFDWSSRWFCHPQGGLIQGAPASPTLFHLFMEEYVEPELADLCGELNLVWTRYVDDFLFSSNTFISKSTQARITSFLKEKGFRVNARKTRAVDLHRETLTHLGIVIKQREVDITDEVKAKILKSKRGSKTHAQLLAWKKRVHTLNE